MSYKRWVCLFLVSAIVLLCGFGGITYTADPLLQFRYSEYMMEFEDMEIYTNPGIAKNGVYNTVLVGTSMVENTNVQECNQIYGCDMVRLFYSGGYAYNMKRILDTCFDSDNQIERVFWGLDVFQLINPHDQPRYPLPEYLYQDGLLNKLSYLLNLDVFYNFSVPYIKNMDTRETQNTEDAEFQKGISDLYNRENALASYDRLQEIQETVAENLYMENVVLNMEHNVKPLLRENTQTEFVFFFVPYSMLYWDREVRRGTLDAYMYALEYAMSQLLEFENAKIYFFHDQWEIAGDLEHYKDYSHYGPWINSAIMRDIAEGNNCLNKDNYKQRLEDMKQYIYSYPFDGLFDEG